MENFKEFGLKKELMKGLESLGFETPTPVQKEAIAHILNSKKDLIALAQTGTGKTAAFALPILERMKTNSRDLQSIIICPTRELCLQITKDIKNFARFLDRASVTSVYGGSSIEQQIRSLKRGTNIVVGTPGRVCDLIRRRVLKLGTIRWLVLDEADEMLDMGFKEDLDAILDETPKSRQTMLFSATMPKGVNSIARRYMGEAREISIGEKNVGAENVKHEYYIVRPKDRFDALKMILDNLPGVYGILFCRTRLETQRVADMLKRSHYDTEALHGDISQNMRTKIMERFRNKQVRLLVATDVAARGIDVSNLTHVINYNLPDQEESYTHRTGRTGRAQKSGVAISIITPRDSAKIKRIEKMVNKTIELKKVPTGKDICRRQIDSYADAVDEIELDKKQSKKYFSEFMDRFADTDKKELVAKMLANKFGHLMDDYKTDCDLNAQAKNYKDKKDDSGYAGLKINLGKRQGLDVKKLFSLLNSNKKLKGIDVGRIDLKADYSLFSVDKKDAAKVVRALTGRKFKGTDIFVSKRAAGAGPGKKFKPSKYKTAKKRKKSKKR